MKKEELNILYVDNEGRVVYDFRDTPFSIFNYKTTGYVLDKKIRFGKDFPTGAFDYDLFSLLTYLTYDSSLDNAFKNIEFKSIRGEHLLVQFLDGMVTSSGDPYEKLDKLSLKELKKLLRKHGIYYDGDKEFLKRIARLNISPQEFGLGECELTAEGEKFLKEYEWINLYNFALFNFEFDDYYKFKEENGGDDIVQMALDYVDAHLKNANKLQDYLYVSNCYQAKSRIYLYNDDLTQSLRQELKKFIFHLNPSYSYKIDFAYDKDNLDSIEVLKNDDFKEVFMDVWDEMDLKKEYVSKTEAFELLESILASDNPEELSKNYYTTYLA